MQLDRAQLQVYKGPTFSYIAKGHFSAALCTRPTRVGRQLSPCSVPMAQALLVWVIGCLHDPANVQQTSSKCIQNTRELLDVCWTFVGSCKHPINLLEVVFTKSCFCVVLASVTLSDWRCFICVRVALWRRSPRNGGRTRASASATTRRSDQSLFVHSINQLIYQPIIQQET